MKLPQGHKTVITLSETPDAAGQWHLFLQDAGDAAPRDVMVGERAELEHFIAALTARRPDRYT